MSERALPIVAKKSFRDNSVSIGINLRCWGHGDGVKIAASTELTTEQARVLAWSLINLADAAEAKSIAKAAAEERRKKWFDREVAAGRMVRMEW